MIDPKLQRFLALMSAANYSTSDVRSLVKELQAASLSEIVENFSVVREAIRQIDISIHQLDLYDESSQAEKDIANFAQRSEPSASQAALRLRRRLVESGHDNDIPEFSPKQGFRRWLRRVLQVVGPSEVLNAAITEFAGQSKPDDGWKLSGS